MKERYSPQYLKEYFEIPTDQAAAFITFVESKKFDRELLSKTNELQLFEHLLAESQLFLIAKSDQN